MSRDIQRAVYLLCNQPHGRLYCGYTADLARRVAEHRTGSGSRYTRRFGIRRLVWYEFFDTLAEAQHAEWLMKRWRRAWKDELIAEANPEWRDLYEELA